MKKQAKKVLIVTLLIYSIAIVVKIYILVVGANRYIQ
ncbi:MAG: hypothetical protein H6Q13_2834 [Bacteroidetes bacterium]|nr:hypothetical protein [Bacteroidota bacterium]